MTENASDGAEPFRAEDWLSSAETIKRVREATLSPAAHSTLATRAHAGLVRAHAALMVINDTQRHPDCAVPAAFWWAKGHEALTQNWEVGDFETWIRNKVRYQIFGVRFHREDVDRMLGPARGARSSPAALEGRDGGGRPMSALWPEWVAELVRQIHDEGVPEGIGAGGSDELIATIADRLAKRGLDAPSRTTVQPTAKAVLHRLRAGN